MADVGYVMSMDVEVFVVVFFVLAKVEVEVLTFAVETGWIIGSVDAWIILDGIVTESHFRKMKLLLIAHGDGQKNLPMNLQYGRLSDVV